MKKPVSTKFAHIASEAEKQGATLTGGFYNQLDRLSTNYTRRVTIPKNPRTYYIGEDVQHRPSVIYLEALNAKRREAELEAQAEEIQREVRRQKKADERRKKREAAEKLKKQRDEELQRAIAEEREREDSTKSNGAFKAMAILVDDVGQFVGWKSCEERTASSDSPGSLLEFCWEANGQHRTGNGVLVLKAALNNP